MKVEELPFFGPVINEAGLKSQLGDNGQYYCSGKLFGMCKCCDGGCGPDNGENCDACMELDIKRRNLGPHYLINPRGNVCKMGSAMNFYCLKETLSTSKSLFGKSNVNRLKCTDNDSCRSCRSVTFSVGSLGRYKNITSKW